MRTSLTNYSHVDCVQVVPLLYGAAQPHPTCMYYTLISCSSRAAGPACSQCILYIDSRDGRHHGLILHVPYACGLLHWKGKPKQPVQNLPFPELGDYKRSKVAPLRDRERSPTNVTQTCLVEFDRIEDENRFCKLLLVCSPRAPCTCATSMMHIIISQARSRRMPISFDHTACEFEGRANRYAYK